MLSISYCREVNCTFPPNKSRLKRAILAKSGYFLLYLWYHPWYQAFFVCYQYRIGIEASDYKSISIVSVSKFQVLESISIVSVSNFQTLEVSVSYRYRKKRYRRALGYKYDPVTEGFNRRPHLLQSAGSCGRTLETKAKSKTPIKVSRLLSPFKSL